MTFKENSKQCINFLEGSKKLAIFIFEGWPYIFLIQFNLFLKNF